MLCLHAGDACLPHDHAAHFLTGACACRVVQEADSPAACCGRWAGGAGSEHTDALRPHFPGLCTPGQRDGRVHRLPGPAALSAGSAPRCDAAGNVGDPGGHGLCAQHWQHGCELLVTWADISLCSSLCKIVPVPTALHSTISMDSIRTR